MIVNRPQFDTSKVRPGDIVWLSSKTRIMGELERGCIVIEVNPLVMRVAFYRNEDSGVEFHQIKVEEVVSKNMILFPLHPTKTLCNQRELDSIKAYFINNKLPWSEFHSYLQNIINHFIKSKEDEFNG